MMDNV